TGSQPYGSLIENNGKLYGITQDGGANSDGVIFSFDPAGEGTYTDLYDFDGDTGSSPYGSLTVKDNKLYGLTYNGGTNNAGVIFEYDPAGEGTYTKKYDFDPDTDKGYPYSTLTLKDA